MASDVGRLPSHTEILLRRGDSIKAPLKEKFVALYEAFFKGEDPSVDALGGKTEDEFWDDLFLLKVNAPFLERCVILSSEEQILLLRPTLNKIFGRCALALEAVNDISPQALFRVAHVLETLQVLLRSTFRKRFGNFGIDVISIICGVDRADAFFPRLFGCLQTVITHEETSASIKAAAINVLVIIATATENINQNVLIEYMMKMLDAFLLVLMSTSLARDSIFKCLFLLMVLVNYQKYENLNPHIRTLSQLDSDVLLTRVAQLISGSFADFNRDFRNSVGAQQGILSKLSSFFASFIPQSPSMVDLSSPGGSTPSVIAVPLFALYEMLTLSKPFTHQCFTMTLPSMPLGGNVQPAAGSSLAFQFFHLCTHVFGEHTDIRSLAYCRLALTCLLVISEDHGLLEMLREPMQEPKGLTEAAQQAILSVAKWHPGMQRAHAPSMMCIIMDLAIEYMRCNMKRDLQTDLYCKSLGILHRIMCFAKKNSVRISYDWRSLWLVLFRLIKFISTDEMARLPGIMDLSLAIASIFNLFITYGDTFLSSPADYDELYYELIRSARIIDVFYDMAEVNDAGGEVVQYLDNIKTIIRHFTAKIQEFTLVNQSTLSFEQVMNVIKTNYDSLKLNLLDNLDFVLPYVEGPKEAPFILKYIRSFVYDMRLALVILPATP